MPRRPVRDWCCRRAGHLNPDRLQGFLAKAAWGADELRDRFRAYAVAALAADDAVLIADETGGIRKVAKTAGVQRQCFGTADRIENAQVSVSLSYGSSRGCTPTDRELYLGRLSRHHRRARASLCRAELSSRAGHRGGGQARAGPAHAGADVTFTCFLADEAYGPCACSPWPSSPSSGAVNTRPAAAARPRDGERDSHERFNEAIGAMQALTQKPIPT
ncbi:transposase [Streptomyces sp. NPDC054866]